MERFRKVSRVAGEYFAVSLTKLGDPTKALTFGHENTGLHQASPMGFIGLSHDVHHGLGDTSLPGQVICGWSRDLLFKKPRGWDGTKTSVVQW